jgi:hypothetical protein
VAFDLREDLATYPALSLEGPDVDTVARTDAQGLRVTLPAGRGDTRPVILELPLRLRGDFDVVLGYELLAVGTPAPQYGAGVTLRLFFDTPSPPLQGVLGRGRKPHGNRFGGHKVVKGPDGKDQYLNNVDEKATSSRGKLRLARTGSQLQYFVAEGELGFKKLQSVEIGTADLLTIQVHCHTMYTPISLDARLTELVVEADQFPDGIPSARSSVPAVPAEAPREPGRKGLLTAFVLSVLTLLLLGAVGVWLYARQRRDAGREMVDAPAKEPLPRSEPASTAIKVPCSRCGKASKARAGLVGKKVKCPHCDAILLIPGTRENESSHPAP